MEFHVVETGPIRKIEGRNKTANSQQSQLIDLKDSTFSFRTRSQNM